jgi:hypothetical protein
MDFEHWVAGDLGVKIVQKEKKDKRSSSVVYVDGVCEMQLVGCLNSPVSRANLQLNFELHVRGIDPDTAPAITVCENCRKLVTGILWGKNYSSVTKWTRAVAQQKRVTYKEASEWRESAEARAKEVIGRIRLEARSTEVKYQSVDIVRYMEVDINGVKGRIVDVDWREWHKSGRMIMYVR